VLIRCERCQALFSLQDGVVRGATGGAGFAVECGRCELVFEAKSPSGARPTAASAPRPVTTPSRGQPVLPARTTTPAQGSAAAEKRTPQPTGEELARALRPKRPGPTDDGETDLLASALARRRKTRRLAVGAVVLALLAGAGLALAPVLKKKFGGLPVAAQQKVEKAHQKLLFDDNGSLEQAVTLLTDAARMAPGEAGPEGERAFTLLVLAGTHKDVADRLEAQARELNDKVAKLQLEKPEGWEKQVAALSEQVSQIATEREPHVRDATRLLQQGLAAAKAAREEDPDEPVAQRAMALFHALNDSADQGSRFADRAEQLRPNDPLNAWVRARLQLCGSPSREKQERGLQQLALARQDEPQLLSALYDQASVEVERQQLGPAREKLTQLLTQNPQHERARRLLAQITPPVAAPAAAPVAPSSTPRQVGE
jgi:hypothetical protein